MSRENFKQRRPLKNKNNKNKNATVGSLLELTLHRCHGSSVGLACATRPSVSSPMQPAAGRVRDARGHAASGQRPRPWRRSLARYRVLPASSLAVVSLPVLESFFCSVLGRTELHCDN